MVVVVKVEEVQEVEGLAEGDKAVDARMEGGVLGSLFQADQGNVRSLRGLSIIMVSISCWLIPLAFITGTTLRSIWS